MSDVAHGDVTALARQAGALRTFRQAAADATRLAERRAHDTVQRIAAELGRRRAELARAEEALRDLSDAER